MWSIRILTGPLKGQSYSITKSSTVIGRSEVCDITIDLPSVSKKHLKIEVHGHGIQLTDLNSSNGTFVNGKQISNHIFQSGDKLSLHDVILDIVPTQSQVTNIPLGSNAKPV